MFQFSGKWCSILMVLLFLTSISGAYQLSVNGWLDTRAFASTKENDKNMGFDAHHLYLILDGRIDDHWRAFGEIEFEHSPKISSSSQKGTIKLERLYTE